MVMHLNIWIDMIFFQSKNKQQDYIPAMELYPFWIHLAANVNIHF